MVYYWCNIVGCLQAKFGSLSMCIRVAILLEMVV